MIKIRLDREDRTYTPGSNVKGIISIVSPKAMSHNGLMFEVEGVVSMQYANSKNVSIWDAMLNSLKPIEVIKFSEQLIEPGKFPAGGAEIPFEFPLKPTGNFPLYETYHGVYLSIRYRIHVELIRGIFSSNLKKSSEFIVHVPGQGFSKKREKNKVEFVMKPEKLENVRKKSLEVIPDYTVKGSIKSLMIEIAHPLEGFLQIVDSEIDVKSLELQLVRVETCVVGDSSIKEATEIQNLQIGDGNVCRQFKIPIYMIPPRLFSCPTLKTKYFGIQFEINLIILFTDGHQVTQNLPCVFYREEEEKEEEEEEK